MRDENARRMLQTLQPRWELKNHVTIPLPELPLPELPLPELPLPELRLPELPLPELPLPELPLPELYDNRPLHEQWLKLQGFATGDEEREAVDAGAHGKGLAMHATK
jgi:hypothetical protein